MRTSHLIPALFLIPAWNVAQADIAPNASVSDLPDLMFSGFSFTGPGGAVVHEVKLGLGPAAKASVTLKPGKWAALDLCEYEFELKVINGGPGVYNATSIPVHGLMQVEGGGGGPGGSSYTAKGEIPCGPDGAVAAGEGCSAKESILLVAGKTTKFGWDITSDVSQYSSYNNGLSFDVAVPTCGDPPSQTMKPIPLDQPLPSTDASPAAPSGSFKPDRMRRPTTAEAISTAQQSFSKLVKFKDGRRFTRKLPPRSEPPTRGIKPPP